jgi:hypothetical protein
LDERWQRRWRPWVARPEADWRWWQHAVRGGGRMFISGLAVSVSAGLVSAITSVTIFGILTPGALAMNVLLVPVALLAVTAGFAALLAGLAGLGPLVVLFNHAGIAVLWVVAHGMEAARLPLMFWSAQFRAPWCGPAALAVLLGVMLWGYAQGWRRSIGGLWLPVALVLVVLLCGVRAPEGAPARPGLAGGLTGLPAARWVNPARVSLAGSPAAWRETPVRERLAGLPVPAEASIAMRP